MTTKIYGVFNGYIWRDEANGKATFRFLTKHNLFLNQMYLSSLYSRNELTGLDEKWFEVKVNSFNHPTPAIERGTPICLSGYFNSETNNNKWDFIVEDFLLSSNDDITAIRYLRKYDLPDDINKQIISKYGNDVFKLYKFDDIFPFLSESLGIGNNKTEKVLNYLQKLNGENETFKLLSVANIPYPYTVKAVKKYGTDAVKMLSCNPYLYGSKIGLRFRQCDELAKRLGISATSNIRLKQASNEVMDSFSKSGHIYTPVWMFRKKMEYFLNNSVFEEKISSSCFYSVKNEKFYTENMNIYDIENKIAEERVAKNIKRLAVSSKVEPYSEKYLPIIEQKCGMFFGKQQKEAFAMLKSRGIKILTGGPGTGKTTTVKGLIYCYQLMHPDHKIKLSASTGRAAQRLAESTGIPATTVHKMLDYIPYGDETKCKDANDPIDADLIVVDEFSMIDLILFDKLLEAIKNNTTMLFVGDIHQLEAVGAGAILRDLLSVKTNKIESTLLTEVFRQKDGSPIIDNAIKVNKGETDLFVCPDFMINKESSQEDMFNVIKNLYLDLYDKNNLYDTQILCPSYKGEVGIDKINKVIRDIVNPDGKTLIYGFSKYREGDKVIFTKNNADIGYYKGYYNGDIGIVKKIEDDTITVSLVNHDVVIDRESFDELKLAYAITIHRSQGSEFNNIIVVIPKEPASMLVRNLFYTAITRAKKRVFVISENDAMDIAIKTNKIDDRRTNLPRLIKEI